MRLSGRGCHDVAARVLRPFEPEPLRTARRATAVDPANEERLDEVLYLPYRAPHSYTGEDMVEVTTHGGLLAPAEVLGALLAAGARLALPGEFTRRALLNGKVDLLQAEAVGDLVDATSRAQRRAALSQLDRGLSRRVTELRDEILDLEALVSYEIDFPEEDHGPIPPERIAGAIEHVAQSVARLLRTADEGERLREGAVVVIAGRPNTGKSSLFNALLGVERAIVTDTPGTTRDAIEAGATCGGFPFRLVDTAGIRDATDHVERLGIEVSRRYLAGADVVLFCIEAGRDTSAEEEEFMRTMTVPVIRVRTKSDAAAPGSPRENGSQVAVSAVSGAGLEALRQALARLAFAALSSRADIEPVITRTRHRNALEKAAAEIEAFSAARSGGVEGLVAATHLRAAVTALEVIVGVVTSEDVLDRVFRTFCIGK